MKTSIARNHRTSSSLDAALFDVDGTIVDTVDLHALAWSEAFRNFRIDVTAKEVRDHIGKGGDQLMPAFLNVRQIEEFGSSLEEVRGKIFKNRYLGEAKAFPFVRNLFEIIKARGLDIGLASSCKAEELDHYLSLANVGDLVTAATTGDDVDRSKPRPDIFLSILGKLGDVDPSRAVAVGDSPYDAEAAGGARVRTIGLLCGGFSIDVLRHAGCIEIFEDPEHLLRDFERSSLAA